MNLSHWLRKSPQPVAILADERRIEVSRNARGWKELVATITSLDPSKLTALDGSNNVLRSITLESDEDKPAASPEPSPEMTDLQLFARLLSEAYEKGRQANQPIIDSAMAFVERQSQRLAKAEGDIDRLRLHIHKQNMQIGELTGAATAGPSGEESLLGSLMAGAMQAAVGGGSSPLAVVANGGAKPGGKK